MNIEKAYAVLKFIPVIIAVIRSLEEFLPVSGAGKEKIELVRSAIEASYDNAKEIWPYLEKIIVQLVGIANAFGVFKKS